MFRTMMRACKIAMALAALGLVFSSGAEVVPAAGELVVAPAEAWSWPKWLPLPRFRKVTSDSNDEVTTCADLGISCIVWE